MNWKSLSHLVLLACLAVSAQAGDRSKPASPSQEQNVFGESEYRVGPEDVVQIFVWKEPDLSTMATVRPDGKISVPLISELEASGKTAAQLQTEVADRLKKYIATPVVTVIVKEVNSPKISVLGQVRKPDRYRIKQRITVLEAVALAGGFTDFAKRDHVTIIRNAGTAQNRTVVDLKRLVKEGGGDALYLEPGDTVYVE